ncbi:MAG: hypothetical protein CVT78_07400 [Alphaproteobacteria bacterium HGW-Alphaproteobacteria-17]|uniref:hypothetical protein n=1 Tax=Sphingopyxis solisilvae TaxID=1886788 RepID=UPI000CAF7760|nr:hypothetical protein [Sphingopyxis solisilvae]PKP86972.1 MAG: hypothetical protein CVT78_07400 [Alphaproteobacteria bacterium HGW-Alphaproteobacteria-17]
MRLAVLSLLTVSLAACATPETRLRTGLVNAGLSKPIAACMAERMVDRLSLLQLRRLGSLASLKDKNASDLSLNQFLHKVRALKDPEILTVTTSSAALCAFR